MIYCVPLKAASVSTCSSRIFVWHLTLLIIISHPKSYPIPYSHDVKVHEMFKSGHFPLISDLENQHNNNIVMYFYEERRGSVWWYWQMSVIIRELSREEKRGKICM